MMRAVNVQAGSKLRMQLCAKAPFATPMQPLQCDLRHSAATHKSIGLAAAAVKNFDATIPLRSADTELGSTIAQHHQRREKVSLNH